MRARIRRALGWLIAPAVAVSCSISSLDDLKQNADAGGTGGSAGSCEQGVDCNGCPDCAYWCACVASSNVVQCLLACQDGGGPGGAGGAGGAGAAGGLGGSAGSDAGDDASACLGADAQNCTQCCADANPLGVEQYGVIVDKCFCSEGAVCFGQCTAYCSGQQPEPSCTNCVNTDPGLGCAQQYCQAPCQAFLDCSSQCQIP